MLTIVLATVALTVLGYVPESAGTFLVVGMAGYLKMRVMDWSAKKQAEREKARQAKLSAETKEGAKDKDQPEGKGKAVSKGKAGPKNKDI
ncbi:hypothetical protein H632_c298p2 [Helicosporidium sp. ATCC 50920]|nr:hypothetical protein H632_c298p2 [Helicosporidium sp. ATCC 50920]|eukprot:KDD76252.1 hypothetical protein H632_c298p2 [Helicosporidium sp. ATCC 50920]